MLPTERKGVRWRVVPFNACRHSVECVSVRRLGFLRSIGRNKLFLSIGRNKLFSIFLSAAAVGGSRTESSPPCWRVSTPMPQSAGTSGFAPAWGVHHCSSLQASEGGSSYGSRGRPPDTTGRAVPLTGFPRGFLEEGSRPRIAAAHRPAVGPTPTRTMDHGPATPAGTTLPSSPTYDSHIGSTYLTLLTAVVP